MSRLNLSQRTAIECGIYERLTLKEIAKKAGVLPDSIFREIRNNRTLVRGDHPNGKAYIYMRGMQNAWIVQ